jgi:hypothetical protein
VGRTRRIAALIVAAALALGAIGGCSLLGLSDGGDGGGATATRSGQVQLPENTVFTAGSARPRTPLPSGSPIRTPLAELPSLPSSSPYPDSSLSPIPTVCTGRIHPGVRNGLSAEPGTRSAIVSWWSVGDPALRSYQLAAVSQSFVMGLQPPWKWMTVEPGTGCTLHTATFTGLETGTAYVFVLHAVVQNYQNVPPLIPEIGRSSPVVVL